MPFFIKKKKGANPRAKYNQNKESKKKGTKRKLESRDDEEITSDEDDLGGVSSAEEGAQSEDEFETVQEKKVRLAKVYLEEIEKQERERLEDKTDENAVAKRLKVDYLKQVGKLRLSVADQFTGVDVNKIEVLKCKEHHIVTSVCVSSDGYIYSGCKKGSVVKWSLSTKKKVGCIPYVKKSGTGNKILGHNSSILCIALSSDNKYMAIGDCGKDIQIWDPQTLKHVGALIGHRASVTGLVFRRETHTLYSCSKDKAVKVWSVDVMSYVETLYGHQNQITSIDALSRERAITSGTDTSIRIWKIVEESQLLFNGHSKSIDIVRLINEENFISGGDDGQLCVWSVLKKKPACTVQEAHGFDTPNSEPFWITAVASLLNTDLIASGSYNGTIKLWKASENFRTLTEIHSISLTGFVNDLKFTSDGKYLIAGVGPEHKFGRWTVIKSAKSSVVLIPLIGSLC